MISIYAALATFRLSAPRLQAGAIWAALNIFLLAFPAQSAQSVDTTQVAQFRAQLQAVIQQAAKTQAEVDSLEKVVKDLRDSLNSYERASKWIGGIVAFISLSAVWGFVKRQTKKLDSAITKAVYRVDPLTMPIKLPATGMEKQFERLRELEFTNLDKYPWLDDSCTRNAVVVLATKDEEAEKLKNFIVAKKLDERNDLAFVVYTKGARINPAILGEFDNVTFANNHLTLVQALFVAARGIVRKAQ